MSRRLPTDLMKLREEIKAGIGRRPVPMNVIANQYYAFGWNACIDELMGGSDEDNL